MDVDTEIARGQPGFVLKDDEYSEDVRPGCIGISFQRGHAEWLDERYVEALEKLFASWLIIISEAKPQQSRPGTFKRLAGPFGKKIFFEFRPLSQGKQ